MPIDKELWNLFVDLENTRDAASQRAQQLCIEFLGSEWKDDTFTVEKLSGGMTNLVFKCSIPSSTVLLRIQCDKDVMQLQAELVIFMKLAENGLGPKLLGVFPGGRLEEFIPSRILTYEECRNPGFSFNIARTMAQIHQIDAPLSKTTQMISTMRQWVERIHRNGGNKFELFSKNAGISNDKFPSTVTLEDFGREIDQIERFLEKQKSPVRLTHNDLYATNILLRNGYTIKGDGTVNYDGPEKEREENPLVIIDFEFGMYNYRGFDIGNHINELGLTYFEEMPTYSFSLEKLLDKSLHRNYIHSYLQETYRLLKEKEEKPQKDGLYGEIEKDIKLLEEEVLAFQAIANFWWGIWNIICDQEGIVGMDFFHAFRDRLCLYYYMKNF